MLWNILGHMLLYLIFWTTMDNIAPKLIFLAESAKINSGCILDQNGQHKNQDLMFYRNDIVKLEFLFSTRNDNINLELVC